MMVQSGVHIVPLTGVLLCVVHRWAFGTLKTTCPMSGPGVMMGSAAWRSSSVHR